MMHLPLASGGLRLTVVRAGVAGGRNAGGVRSSAGYAVGGGGYTIYPSYAAAIDDWFNIMENRYINWGLTSVIPFAIHTLALLALQAGPTRSII